ELGAEPGPLRVALATHTPADEKVAPDCERAVLDTARLLEQMGHRIEEAKLDFVPAEFGPSFRLVIGANVRAGIEAYAQQAGRKPVPEEFEKVTWMFFESGAST